MIKVDVEKADTPKDLEALINEFLAKNKENIKTVDDINVTRYPDGTLWATITYTEKEKTERRN